MACRPLKQRGENSDTSGAWRQRGWEDGRRLLRQRRIPRSDDEHAPSVLRYAEIRSVQEPVTHGIACSLKLGADRCGRGDGPCRGGRNC